MDESAASKYKDPKGGLTPAGRAHYKRTEGANLKPGVKNYSSASTPNKKRWVRWALRFAGRSDIPPLKKPNGEPTRFALMFAAWGEPVPTSNAAVRAVYAKAKRRRAELGMGETAAVSVVEPESSQEVTTEIASAHIQNTVFERGDHIFIVAPVLPIEPNEQEIEEFAFAKAIRDVAPNPNLMWLKGQYVEADKPNLNGAMWLSDDLALASLTPTLMPVTVMHDPATAVGLIADTRMVPEGEAVRPRLDTTLALWKHRFPDVVEETVANYKQGSLMQSMECLPSHYDCGVCGRSYPKLPGGAERENWCAHLRGEEAASAPRILRGVCFTGTGLIFGTRGASGAYTEAHLDVFQDEVAEFHEKATRDKSTRKRNRSKRQMEISDERYTELVAAEAKLDTVETEMAEIAAEAEKVADLTATIERLEIEKKAAEDARDEEQAKREALEESARADVLASERIAALSTEFTGKLPESVKSRLTEQAKSMSDEDWSSRVDELAELVAVSPTAAADETDTFTPEEVARASFSSTPGNGEVSPQRRASVVAGLLKATSR